MGRLASRVVTVAAALAAWPRLRRPIPDTPSRILVAHNLLLGDALMATALLAKLRERYPSAHIAMTIKPALAPLYTTKPYGVVPLVFDPAHTQALKQLVRDTRRAGGFDLAFVLGDNRYGWLARALGARAVVAHAGDTPSRKNWPIDHLVPYPLTPHAWGDMVMTLAPGSTPRRFTASDWPAPPMPPGFAQPRAPYIVLHVGASTPLKLWPAERWRQVADATRQRGLAVAWSAGPGEAAIITAAQPRADEPVFAGTLDLAGLWHLLGGARALVCPDTGAAHLGRIVGTPTVALFGPGSATVSGAGDFFSLASFRAVTVSRFECRDQTVLFRRNVAWVQRCGRGYGSQKGQCALPRCMHAVGVAEVLSALDNALANPPRG